MRIIINKLQFKRLVESTLSPQEQLDKFNYEEDKVKSSFMTKKKIKSWYDRLKTEYPNLKIRFQIDGDVLRAEAQIDRNSISEGVKKDKVVCDNCGWEWDLSDGGEDPYTCHQCGFENEEKDVKGKRVMVYYNLHKHTFSVTYKGKVVLHADYVKLKDVEFRVRPTGKEKVRREKSKNVHAFVIGDLVDYCEYPCEKTPQEKDSKVVTYDPYKYDSFVYKSDETPIYNAKEVEMINKKNKLFVIKEIKK
jgi:hypothetical protein